MPFEETGKKELKMTSRARTAKIVLIVLYCIIAARVSSAQVVPPAAFPRIDRAVQDLPPGLRSSIPDLAAALGGLAETDWEKTRAVYAWVTRNIAYDTDSYFRGVGGATDAAGVLRTGKSVCEGYANLFQEIARALGLEAVKLTGYAKGYGYREGVDTGGTNHAWNAVKIEGVWRLFDATWGAGHVDGRDFEFDYDEFYFDTPPEQFIFTHFPADPAFQLLDTPVSRALFFRLPRLDGDEFAAGVNPAAVREAAESGAPVGMPVIYGSDVPARLVEFPLTSTLRAGRPYRIVIETPSPYIMVVNGAFKETAPSRGGRFEIYGTFAPGNLTLFLAPVSARSSSGVSYKGFINYEVK